MKNRSALFFTVIIALFFSQNIFAQSKENLKYRKWRITIFPPLSTNGTEAPNYTARYSINLLAGNNGGLDGFEFGGLVNYTRYYVSGIQIAGLSNISNGDIEGITIAGLFNYSRNNISGVQVGGLGNFAKDDIDGLQAAGGLNVSGSNISGLQVAGIGNISKSSIEGLQGAGIFNFANEDLSGAQFSFITNIGKRDVEGLQITGLLNLAGSDISGLQISGGGNFAQNNSEGLMISSLFNGSGRSTSGLLITGGINFSPSAEGALIAGIGNFSKEMSGLQVSSIFNIADKAEGLQIGLINLAREFDGMPVGLISLYGNGRKNFDVKYSDAGFTDIGITLGTYRVYNQLVLGYNTLLDKDVYRFGLAIGLEKNIRDVFPRIGSETLFVNQEFSVLHHFEQEWHKKTNLIYSYKYLFGNRFANGLSVYAGPSINMQISRVDGSDDYTWYSLWSPSWKGRNYRFWGGFTVGLRLFKQKTLPQTDWNSGWYDGNDEQ